MPMQPKRPAADNSPPLLHPTWRVVAGIILAEIPGALIGVSLAPTTDVFTNCWYGAAFAAPFGFVLGLLWQIRVAVETLSTFRWHIFAYGLFSALLPTYGGLTYGIWAGGVAV
jgi:hypothetical protein